MRREAVALAVIAASLIAAAMPPDACAQTALEARDGNGRDDAVTIAAVADDAGALRVLLADRSGRTALQLARERGYAEMVRMLEAAAR